MYENRQRAQGIAVLLRNFIDWIHETRIDRGKLADGGPATYPWLARCRRRDSWGRTSGTASLEAARLDLSVTASDVRCRPGAVG